MNISSIKIKIIITAFIILNAISINLVFGTTNLRVQEIIGKQSLDNLNSSVIVEANDSIPFAQIVLYRPSNSGSPKYKLTSNVKKLIEISNGKVIRLDAFSEIFFGSFTIAGHKKTIFNLKLVKNKIHYFRIQAVYNYDITDRPKLEVIEVTEETFNNETK